MAPEDLRRRQLHVAQQVVEADDRQREAELQRQPAFMAVLQQPWDFSSECFLGNFIDAAADTDAASEA